MNDLNLPKIRVYSVNASLFKRFLSFLIDILVLDFFVVSSFLSLRKYSFDYLKNSAGAINEAMLLLLFVGILVFYYFYYLQKNFYQTIGMRVMKLYVKSDEPTFENWQFIVRNLYLIPLFPFILLWIVDIIYLILYNKRFSEHVSKTRLVEEHLI